MASTCGRKGFGDTGNDEGAGIAVAGGSVAVTGFFNDTMNFGDGDLISGGSFDIFVAKLSGGV